jgi:DNA-directed RNA polymerase specialized sigma24 family protein
VEVMMNNLSFEDNYKLITTLIRRRKVKWFYPVNWIDFDDVEMIIVNHIYKKWPQYKAEYPLANWLNRIISNQFKNILRDHTNKNMFCYNSLDEDFKHNLDHNLNNDKQFMDFDGSIQNVKEQSKHLLTPKEYKLFIALFFEHRPEEELIREMGYKIIYKNGRPFNKTFNSVVKGIYLKIKNGLQTDLDIT